jgi:TM2 domain-containing membrane protein YozV
VFTGTSLLFGAPLAQSERLQVQQVEPAWAAEGDAKMRMTFITLGVLLGFFGVHNFYAGYRRRGLAQLLITILSLGLASPMTWIWAVIDICTVNRDNRGVRFES